MASYHTCDIVTVGTVKEATVAAPSAQFGNPNRLPSGGTSVAKAVAVQDPRSRAEISSGAGSAITGLRSGVEVGAEPRGDGAARAMRFDGGMEDGTAGHDMTCAASPTPLGEAHVHAALDEDGGVTICGTAHDAGHGAWAGVTRIAADRLGLSTDRVRVHLTDDGHSQTRSPGGSRTVPAVGSAIEEACVALMSAIARRAAEDLASPLFGMQLERLRVGAGRILLDRFEGRVESWSDLAARWEDDPVIAVLI